MAYDAAKTDPEKLAKLIEELGYGVERVEVPAAPKGEDGPAARAPLPEDAPDFLREAYARAREANKPLLIDFWATWCGPCVRLKRETLHDPEVAKMLEHFEVVFVDLDAFPALAKAYGVEAIPDLLFVAPDARLLDRLRQFEAPGPFRARLEAILHPPQELDGSEPDEDRGEAGDGTGPDDPREVGDAEGAPDRG